MAEQVCNRRLDLLHAQRPLRRCQHLDGGSLHYAVAEPPRHRLGEDRHINPTGLPYGTIREGIKDNPQA